MSDWPLVGARRFEAFVRWSTYIVLAMPAGTLLQGVAKSDRLTAAPATVWITAIVLSLALVAGNILVINWSIDTIVGRARRLRLGGVIALALVLVAFIAATFMIPLPAMALTVAAAIGSVAAAFGPVLNARRALLLNAASVALAIPLMAAAGITLLLVGAAVISGVLWGCWASAWMLRVLLELHAAHEDRAALALANERLRITRDLHDVFGRTLATIALKSELASQLVRRGRAERAADEIGEVRRLAGEAGTEVRRVVRGELRTTWDDEVSGARSLLESAGIGCTVTGDPVPSECAQALAWVVREGVTNVLRHSTATKVTLTTAHEDAEVLLTIINDGAACADSAHSSDGTGLHSMSERTSAIGGHVTTRRDGDRFLLVAAIPLPDGEPA